MYQRDYILRMIEMLAELIAGILGFIKKGDYRKASKMLENAYHDFLKQDAAFFHNIPKEEITDKLLHEHNYTNGHLEVLAELMHAEAELAYAKNDKPKSLACYEKSLKLFEFVLEETKTFSFDKQAKVEGIKKRMDTLTEKGGE